jgi:hypothetical protein
MIGSHFALRSSSSTGGEVDPVWYETHYRDDRIFSVGSIKWTTSMGADRLVLDSNLIRWVGAPAERSHAEASTTRNMPLATVTSDAYNNGVRIFLAGASGVIGQRLVPRLVQAGHVVGGLTRSPSKTDLLSHLGAEPILCDVFNREALIQAVRDFKPDVVLNELTDLPDDAEQISELAGLNARIRTEGTRNLIEAARRSGSPKILAQSVAWQLPEGPDAQAVAELERSILAEGGVVLRYGQFYGPGTYNEQQPPKEPRVHIDRAADRTVEALGEPTGIVVITD